MGQLSEKIIMCWMDVQLEGAVVLREANCFCAFCRKERRIPDSKHISLAHFLAVTLFTVALMYTLWGRVEPKALLLWAFFLGVGEIAVLMKWRISVVCAHCGFDPVLYLKDPSTAAQKVKNHIDRLEKSPLGKLKVPDLPKRIKGKKDFSSVSEVGRSLSKHV